jgi:hypothetical protein
MNHPPGPIVEPSSLHAKTNEMDNLQGNDHSQADIGNQQHSNQQ